jgi:hypothetical protein
MNNRLALVGPVAVLVLASCASLAGLSGGSDGGGGDAAAPRDGRTRPTDASTGHKDGTRPAADATHDVGVDAGHADGGTHDAGLEAHHDADQDAGHDDATNVCADAAPQSWRTTSPGPLPGRDEAAIFWTGTDYLVFGGTEWGSGGAAEPGPDGGRLPTPDGGWELGCGVPSVGNTCSDGARYNPTTDKWTRISNVGSPPNYRWDMSWAFGGQQLFTFSGHGGNYGGWIYDLATDTWRATTNVNRPTLRAYHASYYAGNQFFVWGGSALENIDGADGSVGWPLNTGAYYDPRMDVWTPISTTGAPPGGAYYATAASDTQFFVWGGTQDATPWVSLTGNVTNQGFIYSYVLNTWTPMSTVNAPSPRRYAGAVWTGSKFLVWGGYGANDDFFLSSGGIYDPTTDTWVSMSTTNAPSFSPNTIVWTGKRMLLWGWRVDDAGTPVGGATFDPVANAWDAPITLTNAPSFSVNLYVGYTNVWNGSQLFEWGGAAGPDGGYAYPNAGALFTPPCVP